MIINQLPSVGSLLTAKGTYVHGVNFADRTGSATETSTYTANTAGIYIAHCFSHATLDNASASLSTTGTSLLNKTVTTGDSRILIAKLAVGQTITATMYVQTVSNNRSGRCFIVQRLGG